MQGRSQRITHCNGLLTVEEVSAAFKWDIKQLFFTSTDWVNQHNGSPPLHLHPPPCWCWTLINGMIWKYKKRFSLLPEKKKKRILINLGRHGLVLASRYNHKAKGFSIKLAASSGGGKQGIGGRERLTAGVNKHVSGKNAHVVRLKMLTATPSAKWCEVNTCNWVIYGAVLNINEWTPQPLRIRAAFLSSLPGN